MGFLDKLNTKIEKKDNRNDEVIMGGWRAIEGCMFKDVSRTEQS